MAKKLVLDQDKLRKLGEIRELGVNPYPYTYKRTTCAKDFKQKFQDLKPGDKDKTKVSLAGRIMLKRVMGKASFLTIQDESGKFQVYITKDNLGDNYKLFAKKTDLGDII